MNKNLLIVGAGTYAVVAWEIARDMGCFEKIGFVDDGREQTPNGIPVTGTTAQLEILAESYGNIVVAIGNPRVRLSILEKLRKMPYRIVSLVSPRAWVSPSARIGAGCIIEAMAVVHTGCVVEDACLISAGAVVNHASKCSQGVHVDCNATVAGYSLVPAEKKICSGEVFKSPESIDPDTLFQNT